MATERRWRSVAHGLATLIGRSPERLGDLASVRVSNVGQVRVGGSGWSTAARLSATRLGSTLMKPAAAVRCWLSRRRAPRTGGRRPCHRLRWPAVALGPDDVEAALEEAAD